MAKRTKATKLQWWWARGPGDGEYVLCFGAKPELAWHGYWEQEGNRYKGMGMGTFLAVNVHRAFPVGHPLRLRKGGGPIAVELVPAQETDDGEVPQEIRCRGR